VKAGAAAGRRHRHVVLSGPNTTRRIEFERVRVYVKRLPAAEVRCPVRERAGDPKALFAKERSRVDRW
jgi:hypothetical protein